jgi:hypothetical protein
MEPNHCYKEMGYRPDEWRDGGGGELNLGLGLLLHPHLLLHLPDLAPLHTSQPNDGLRAPGDYKLLFRSTKCY